MFFLTYTINKIQLSLQLQRNDIVIEIKLLQMMNVIICGTNIQIILS